MKPKLGIYVNNRASVFLGSAYSLPQLLQAATLAEDLEFDFVSVGDSILAKPRYMPIPVLAAIAGRTTRIKLATGILQPHMRHPVLLAQNLATLDIIAAGRTIFAFGLGTGPPDLVQHEYEIMGIPKTRRGIAFTESIEILKKLWTEENVSHQGSIFTLHNVQLGYGPVQTPNPPIVIACGGYVPKHPGTGPNDFYRAEWAGEFKGPFDRVAKLGDGWMTGIITPEEYRRNLKAIRTIAEERYNRKLGIEFLTMLNCFIHVNANAKDARSEAVTFLENYHRRPFDDETVQRWLIYGAPEECAERMIAYASAGVDYFQLVIASPDQVSQMRKIAEEVRPLLTSPA